MLNETPERIKKLFLLSFTEELIRSYKPIYLYRLKEKIREQEEKKGIRISRRMSKPLTKEEIIKKVKEKSFDRHKKDIVTELKSPISNNFILSRNIVPNSVPKHKRILRIPEAKLPERLQYLKPSPTYERIDFGKLNPLINDVNVNVIECLGPNQKILVEGKMGKKPTGITLTQEEINNIVLKFSTKSRIPIGEGISKVAVGKFTFTSIKTGSTTHFIINKMKIAPFIETPKPFH